MTAQRTDTLCLNQNDFDRLHAIAHSTRLHGVSAPVTAALRAMLHQSTVVAPLEVPADLVTMRSRVAVRDGKSSGTEQYTLVYPEEADIETGRISVLSPLGMALLGKRTGDSAIFNTPVGERHVKIVHIHYQPEAAGEFHL